jgi:hypothetical protein
VEHGLITGQGDASQEKRPLIPSWSKLGHPGDVHGMTALHPKAEVDPRSC